MKDDTGKYRTKDALSQRTNGYQYYCTIKAASNNVGPIKKPENKPTTHKEYGLGEVDALWVVNSSSGDSNVQLKDKCKQRMENRNSPKVKSFDEYVAMRTSCYFLEEKDGVLYCDCFEGMKGKQCKHSIGMMFYTGKWEAESDVRSVPLGKARKRGRPKKNPHCLSKSPPRTVIVETNEELEQPLDFDDIQFSDNIVGHDEPAIHSNEMSKRNKRPMVDTNDNSDDNAEKESGSPVPSKRRRKEVTRIPSVSNSNEPEDEITDIPQLSKNSKPPIKTARQSKRRKILK